VKNLQLLKSIDPHLTPYALRAAQFLRYIGCNRMHAAKILCVRPGGMGDLILAQIALEHLGVDPKSLDWLIESRSASWADSQKLKFHAYDSRPRWLNEYIGRFEIVINTEQLFGLSQAAAILCRNKDGKSVCFDTNRGSSYSDMVVEYDPYDSHEIDEFAKLFSRAYQLPPAKLFVGRDRMQEASLPPMLAIAGRQAESRCLPIERWIQLINSTIGTRNFQIAAAMPDLNFAKDLKNSFSNQAEIVNLPFPEMCDTLSRSEELISIDGGIIHIATYYGVPTTAVFTSGRDKKWGPKALNSKLIFRKVLSCRPCTVYGQVPPCPYNYACKDVWEEQP